MVWQSQHAESWAVALRRLWLARERGRYTRSDLHLKGVEYHVDKGVIARDRHDLHEAAFAERLDSLPVERYRKPMASGHRGADIVD